MPIQAPGATVSLEYSPQRVGQPLKGMEAKSDPSGTFVWSWLVVTNVMRDRDEFDWTGLESRLEKNSKRGLHTILRQILDEVSRNTLVPPFLTEIAGATAVDFNGYLVPVYSHPATREALLKFIEAFGARYDGDRRIGFVEVGLLRQWGEGWAPQGNTGPSSEVTPETRDAVYEGMIDAKDVPEDGGTLLLRIPNPLPKGPPIRFANKEQDEDVDGWLSLGKLTERH